MIEIKTKLKGMKPFTSTMDGRVLLSDGTIYDVVASIGNLEFLMHGGGQSFVSKETPHVTAPNGITEYETTIGNVPVERFCTGFRRDYFTINNGIWMPAPNVIKPESPQVGLKINRLKLIFGGNVSANCNLHENIIQCTLLVVYIWLRRLGKD